MSRDEARYAARRAFGGVEQAKEHQRDARSFRWLAGWPMDLKLGARMLVKSPGLTIVAVTALAIAIGAGAAYLEFTHDLINPRLPVAGADRIVGIRVWNAERRAVELRSLQDVAVWRANTRTIEHLGAARPISRHLTTADGRTEPVRGVEISASAFRLFPVAPLHGRTLDDDDERPDAGAVAVIGHDLWKERFNSDPNAVGSTVRLGSTAHTIVGVMPEGFGFPVNENLWVPLRTDGLVIQVFGRLKDGASAATARRSFPPSRLMPLRWTSPPSRRTSRWHTCPPNRRPPVRRLPERRGSREPRDAGHPRRQHRLHHAARPLRRERRDARLRAYGHARSRDHRSHGARREPRTHQRAALCRGARALIPRCRRGTARGEIRGAMGQGPVRTGDRPDAVLVGRRIELPDHALRRRARGVRRDDRRRDSRAESHWPAAPGPVARSGVRHVDDEIRRTLDRHHRHAGGHHRDRPRDRRVVRLDPAAKAVGHGRHVRPRSDPHGADRRRAGEHRQSAASERRDAAGDRRQAQGRAGRRERQLHNGLAWNDLGTSHLRVPVARVAGARRRAKNYRRAVVRGRARRRELLRDRRHPARRRPDLHRGRDSARRASGHRRRDIRADGARRTQSRSG